MTSQRRFTGYHATLVLVAFFGVVIAVNLTMARYAIGSFGGTVVDNSYVASQSYNDWLAKARAQQDMGWTVSSPVRSDGAIEVTATDALGKPLENALVTLLAEHPVGRLDAVALAFTEVAPGRYRSLKPLPSGRWKTQLDIKRGGRHFASRAEVR